LFEFGRVKDIVEGGVTMRFVGENGKEKRVHLGKVEKEKD
jgi:hypothetical protein